MVPNQLPAAAFHPAPSPPPAVHVLAAFGAMLAFALLTSIAGSAVALTLIERREHLFDGMNDEATIAETASSLR